RGWGEADDSRRIGVFAAVPRRDHGSAGVLRLADCNPRQRDSCALLAAGLLVSGLCVLCVLCGSFLLLLLLLLLNNHREHREHRAEKGRGEQGRANGGAAAERAAAAVRGGRRGLS
ncbi:MAG: hypothetical protein ACK5BN_16610, partial [Planctomycetota bacterium]